MWCVWTSAPLTDAVAELESSSTISGSVCLSAQTGWHNLSLLIMNFEMSATISPAPIGSNIVDVNNDAAIY